jgi:hypothetical protein
VEEYQKAREAELCVLNELQRVDRQRNLAALLCAYLLADLAAKRVRANNVRVRVALAEFEAFSAESARVSAQFVEAATKRRQLAQLSFDAVLKGEP